VGDTADVANEAPRTPTIEERALAARWIDAYNRRDVEGVVKLCDAEVEIQVVLVDPEGHSFSGHAGVREWLGELHAKFSELRAEPRDIRMLGNTFVADGHVLVTPSEGGEEMKVPIWLAIELGEGKICAYRAFRSAEARDEAVAALQA
jgi:ketosteroid isomerase-like protein